MTGARHRVVVVGGGFGGINVASTLGRPDIDVVVVDRANHHLFQPLLYQVATGILSEGVIAPALRNVLKRQENVGVVLAEVAHMDLDARHITAIKPDGQPHRLEYDTLVVAGGATHDYFGHDEWASFAPGMKTLEDARNLRGHILGAFEMAELATTEAERAAYLTFVIIGAGPTGVELAGQVAELTHKTLRRNFRVIRHTWVTILLLDAGDAVLRTFDTKLQHYTRQQLERMGVTIRLNTAAADIDEFSITVTGPQGTERIATRTRIWAAGVRASPLAQMLAEQAGAVTDRAGRVVINPDCTLPGHPEVFALGDMVALDNLPGVAQTAIQQGKYVGAVIRGRLDGAESLPPFKYVDKGAMATIGHRRAVVETKGMRLTGSVAYGAWAFVHLLYLIGWGNRIATFYHWMWSLWFTNNRSQRSITVGPAYAQLLGGRNRGAVPWLPTPQPPASTDRHDAHTPHTPSLLPQPDSTTDG